MNTLNLQPRRRATNLTLQQQVVREHPDLESLPGYVLVIFERQDNGGAIFSRVLGSGEALHSRFPFRDLSKKYLAVPVNDSVLSYGFEHLILLDDGSEEVRLKFHLTYRVADHRKVAEVCEQDPLKQLQGEIARVIGRNCAKRKADMFKARFRDLERIVIDTESARLRSFAIDLGFKIISIDLDRAFPQPEKRVIKTRNRAGVEEDRYENGQRLNRFRQDSRTWKQGLDKDDLNHKYDLQSQILDREISIIDRLDDDARQSNARRLREVQTDAIAQALVNVGASIQTPADLREGFESAREIAADIRSDTAVTEIAEQPRETHRAGGDATTKETDNAEPTYTDVDYVDDIVGQEPRVDTWRNETSNLIERLESAGTDAQTLRLIRRDLEAIAARYFPAANGSNSSISVLTDRIQSDSVVCTVFAPPVARNGAKIMVQVFAHLVDDSDAVISIATKFDDETKRLAMKSLSHDVSRSSKLTFNLSMPGLDIDEEVQDLIWRGQPDAVQFGVRVPDDLEAQEIIGTIYVSQGGVPFGHAKFLLRIADASRPAEQKRPAAKKLSEWKRYEYAFISYASPDRSEVLKRVQMLSRFHIDFFQDLLTLEPGERFEEAIYESIDRSDVFFLFWSTAARDSKSVMKEIRYALERKGLDAFAAPEIVPVIIEGPPPVPPPAELKDIHFNDRFIYFIQPTASPN